MTSSRDLAAMDPAEREDRASYERRVEELATELRQIRQILRLPAEQWTVEKVGEALLTAAERVLLVEAAIGRRLLLGEQVHHINGVRDDNRIENLQLCRDSSEHHRIEATFKRLLPELLEAGVVLYDREAKAYRRA